LCRIEAVLNSSDNKGITVKVEIDGFSMDSPAKSFILKVKGHAGFDSCTRCLEEGEYLKNRTCFPLTSNSTKKRSHDDYINKKKLGTSCWKCYFYFIRVTDKISN